MDRSLPPVQAVVRPKVAVPRAKPTDDAVVYAGRVRAVAVENGKRLDESAANYEDVARRYRGE